MKISIIGSGYVGLVTGVVFAEKGHYVLCIDNNEKKIEILKSKKAPFYEPGLEELLIKNIDEGRLSFSTEIKDGVKHGEVIFVAVGTPPLKTGEADLTYIERVSREIATHMEEYRLIVEKSTVPVQTGEKVYKTIQRYARQDVSFDVASNPEFLREGQALEDALNPDRIVIGVHSKRAEEILRELYKDFNAPLIVTDVKSAEIIKHAANSFLAMKISYINSVANICELAGANIIEVAKGIGLDKRIGPYFLNAGVGYGGSCFPKDVDAFIKISESLGYEFNLLKEVQNINKQQRLRFIKKIQDELWVIKDKTIAILGLSFKPNTDDMREAPAIYIIKELKERGAKIKAYDPKAVKKARDIIKSYPNFRDHFEEDIYEALKDIKLCDSLEEAVKGADCIAIITEWEEFKKLPLEKIKEWLTQPLIIDGRNIYEPNEMKEKGFIYRSIGR